jgi:hypothetical protein
MGLLLSWFASQDYIPLPTQNFKEPLYLKKVYWTVVINPKKKEYGQAPYF